jgi:hypothetical protein
MNLRYLHVHVHLCIYRAYMHTDIHQVRLVEPSKEESEPVSRQQATSSRLSCQVVHPSHVHLFGHKDTQLFHPIVIQAESSFNIFLNILSSSYVSRYYLQTTIFLHTYNLKDTYALCRSADQLRLLLEFLRASSVSDSSPHVKEIRSLRPGWLAVVFWQCRYSYACLGSAPHALELLANQG